MTSINNRSSNGGGASGPGTPISLPRVDLPRPPDPHIDPVGYLRSLPAVRERSRIVTEKAIKNELRHFDVDMSMFPGVVSFVSNIIKVCFRLHVFSCSEGFLQPNVVYRHCCDKY